MKPKIKRTYITHNITGEKRTTWGVFVHNRFHFGAGSIRYLQHVFSDPDMFTHTLLSILKEECS